MLTKYSADCVSPRSRAIASRGLKFIRITLVWAWTVATSKKIHSFEL